MAISQTQYAGSAPTQTGMPTAKQLSQTNLKTMLYFIFIVLPMGIVLFIWYQARRPFVAAPAVADWRDAYKDEEEMGENELLLIAEIKKRHKENRLGEEMSIEDFFKELAND